MQQELKRKEEEFRRLEIEFDKEHRQIREMAREIIKKLKRVRTL